MLKRIIPQSSYARNVLTLMTGTSLAQAIPIAISPILTRIYSPEDFGVFALYMALVSILSVLVTGRYELAILIPKRDRDAINIVALSVSFTILISVLLLLIFALFNSKIIQLLGMDGSGCWLYVVPLSTLVMGLYQSLNYWNNRQSQYKRMAISRTANSGTASLIQLGLGSAGVGTSGLIGGQLAGVGLAITFLMRMIWREDWVRIKTIKINRMISLAKKYINFPKFLILAHGFNTASGQMPVILLGSFFTVTASGFYGLTQRVMGAPMTLIAGAMGDVFRQEASKAYAYNGNCKLIYKKTFKRLLMISFIPFLIFFFVAPGLFAFIFGQQWQVAGVYAQILSPMFFLKFITSPLSSMFIIAQKQRLDLIWQVCLLVMIFSAFFLGHVMMSVYAALIAFSSVYCFMYIVNGFVSYQLALGRWK